VNLEGGHFVLTSGSTKVGVSMSELICSAEMLQDAVCSPSGNEAWPLQGGILCCMLQSSLELPIPTAVWVYLVSNTIESCKQEISTHGE
jgi:hypothetical protein